VHDWTLLEAGRRQFEREHVAVATLRVTQKRVGPADEEKRLQKAWQSRPWRQGGIHGSNLYICIDSFQVPSDMLNTMSPQRSNHQALIEGTLSCFEESSTPRITARQIADASGANLASITYHFGSTEALVALALEEGFKRWLDELVRQLGDVEGLDPVD